jgi:hypothetical protein
MTVWNPNSGQVQPAGDLTAGRAIEVYETAPWYEGGSAAVPLYFSAVAGSTIPGAGNLTLPNTINMSDRWHQWTPYYGIKAPAAGGATALTFTFLASPDGTWTVTYNVCDAAGAAITLVLTTGAGANAWTYHRMPPFLGCDGQLRINVANGGGAGADCVVIACAVWRP